MTDYLTVARGLGSVEGNLEHAMVLADVQSLPVTLRKKWYSLSRTLESLLEALWAELQLLLFVIIK